MGDRSDVTGVEATIARLMEGDNVGDLEVIASCYAEDAVLLGPSGAEVRGRDAIRRSYASGFERFALEVGLEVEAMEVGEGWAWCRGTTEGRYVWRDGREPTPLADRFVMILERGADGVWRVSTLMWNPVAGGASQGGSEGERKGARR